MTDHSYKYIPYVVNPVDKTNFGGSAKYEWFRKGTPDAHTSQTVMMNVATVLENRGKEVNYLLY